MRSATSRWPGRASRRRSGALDEPLQQTDRAAWTRAYLAVDRAEYPNIWQIRAELPACADDGIFETVLAAVLAGLRLQAPRPCGCDEHAAAAAAP